MKNLLKEAHKMTKEIKREYPEVDYKFQLGLCLSFLYKKGVDKKVNKKENFNNFRFEGLNYRSCSNKYYTMNRVNKDKTKIVVKVADSHLLETKFGYALILDYNHVVFIKDWQVSRNFFGNEVLLTKEFFKVKEWGEHVDFCDNEENLIFDNWVKVAEEQENSVDEDGIKNNEVKWNK